MLAIASLCLLVYDILITLDQEIFTIAVVEIAMALRVWALYHQSRRIFLFLALLVVAATSHGIVINAISLYVVWTSNTRTAEQPYLAACNRISTHFPGIYGTIFYSPLVLEVVFFSMTIAQVIRYGWISGVPLISHIRHNGIKFFSLALAAILFAVVGVFFQATKNAARNSNIRGAFSENSLNRSTQDARGFNTRTNGIPQQLTELGDSELDGFDGFQNDGSYSSSYGGGSAAFRLETIREEASHSYP
ncbi:hypothetical protein Clacol_003286 [Clathrus columnatus]|uniref:G-protein coupled receptors family 1 profile domain-containing protein n=1 Tax=Clathrus columnatus TaxID=1419009 RepID=A0AAV5A748_9AGAM|nr:hypothetical protein Clacol_003286 [Clathrus columnatus]